MTCEEALELAKGGLQTYYEKYPELTYQIEFQKTVIEALEKQIPKKSIDVYKTCDTGEIDYWKCPSCNYEHQTDWGSCDTDYCLNCGQAIDWGDV